MANPYRVQFSQLGWRGQVGLVLAVAVGIAAAIALIIVSLSLAVILIPVVAIALAVGRWRLNKAMAEAARQYEERRRDTAGRVIETDYAVIDDDERRR
jgi:hypothetical protein